MVNSEGFLSLCFITKTKSQGESQGEIEEVEKQQHKNEENQI